MCVWIKNTSESLKGAIDVGTHSSADEVAKKSNFASQNPQRQIWGGGTTQKQVGVGVPVITQAVDGSQSDD